MLSEAAGDPPVTIVRLTTPVSPPPAPPTPPVATTTTTSTTTTSTTTTSTTTTAATTTTPTTTPPAPAPAPAPAPSASLATTPALPPADPGVVPPVGQATAWGCSAALAYLQAYAAKGFALECPGYAEGHQAMTCLNVAGVCPGSAVIAIADACPQAYMNEASNSYVVTGTSDAAIDPYGSCP